MGYRGKVEERARARELRAQSWTLLAIADELGVAKSSVSTWVRDVQFEPRPRNRGNGVTRPHPAHLRKLAEIEEMNRWGAKQIGELSEREFLAAGTALYWGEGGKTTSAIYVANTDPAVIRFFVTWVRHFFDVDETRWRGRLYLHEGLDLADAQRFWSEVSGIPITQFTKPYRAQPDIGIRHNKHEFGCFMAVYGSARIQRAVMGLVRALPGILSTPDPG
jgi:transcriptional regulator with XRE-family HTH domain